MGLKCLLVRLHERVKLLNDANEYLPPVFVNMIEYDLITRAQCDCELLRLSRNLCSVFHLGLGITPSWLHNLPAHGHRVHVAASGWLTAADQSSEGLKHR